MNRYRDQNKKDAAATKNQEKIKVNTELEEVNRLNKSLKDLHEDQTKYPSMPKKFIVPWQYFRTPYLGMDREIDEEVMHILNEFANEKIDFRPYMNDTPTCVLTTDTLPYI